ncbi:MAG: helix-turn-helix transcriptional regulator [Actinomycetota bacterium]|nr:helix-turn-helix transcriptional regulator [Actinomycetota bacterium]
MEPDDNEVPEPVEPVDGEGDVQAPAEHPGDEDTDGGASGPVETVEAVATAAQDAVATAAQDIGGFIRTQRMAAEVSLRQLAERAGVSNPYLSQIERGLRKPSADVLAQIAKGLRLSAEVLYVRAGILEERPASPVRDALLADDSISERQKQMLLEIYESFRKENTDVKE